jgi:hypothetical protein
MTTEQLKAEARAVERRLRGCDPSYETDYLAIDTIAALITALEAAERDAARWKMLAHMEVNMVAPETLRHYIANPDKLDYAAHLKAVHDSQAIDTAMGAAK